MKLITQTAVAALTLFGTVAFAQGQDGLVNLSVDGNTVQVPVGIAANACDIDANVLAQDFAGADETACEIDQETAAANNVPGYGAGGAQEGLVNVSVDGNTVQVPVGIAANACDIDANVLAQDFAGADETACEIDQETAAANNVPGYGGGGAGGGGNGAQNGLVNLSVDGNTVQVPIGVAANVCDLDANVLARDFAGREESACDIDQETAAENDIPGFGGADGGAADTLGDAADATDDAADDATDAAEDAVEDASDAASQ